jgi:hypothetical protein
VANLYGKLHIVGDPGVAGTSNPATETTRQLVDFNSTFFTSNPNVNTVTWLAVAGSGLQTFTGMSFWSLAVGGAFPGEIGIAFLLQRQRFPVQPRDHAIRQRKDGNRRHEDPLRCPMPQVRRAAKAQRS